MSELWGTHQPDSSIALAWKAIRPLCEEYGGDVVCEALATCLDWNKGRSPYPPTWFTREFALWCDRAQLGFMDAEAARDAYRTTLRLRG